MKYRIVKDGEFYYIQFKVLFFWVYHRHPETRAAALFSSKEEALEEIEKDKKRNEKYDKEIIEVK